MKNIKFFLICLIVFCLSGCYAPNQMIITDSKGGGRNSSSARFSNKFPPVQPNWYYNW